MPDTPKPKGGTDDVTDELTDGSLCRLRGTGGFGVHLQGECRSDQGIADVMGRAYYLYCALTGSYAGISADGAALLARCSDNPYDQSSSSWMGPGGQTRFFRVEDLGGETRAVQKFSAYSMSGTLLTAKPDWVFSRHQGGESVAVNLQGAQSAVALDPESLVQQRMPQEQLQPEGDIRWTDLGNERLLASLPVTNGTLLVVVSIPLAAVERSALRGPLEGIPITDGQSIFITELKGEIHTLRRLGQDLVENANMRTASSATPPVAAYRARVVLQSGEVFASTPAGLSPLYKLPTGVERVFVTDAYLTLVNESTSDAGASTTVRIFDAQSGVLRASETVPFTTHHRPQVTRNGTVLLIRQGWWQSTYPMDFHPHTETLIYEVGRGGGAFPIHDEHSLPGWQRTYLVGTTLVALQPGDPHNNYAPIPMLLRYTLPGIVAPRHGWLQPEGNSRGSWAPE